MPTPTYTVITTSGSQSKPAGWNNSHNQVWCIGGGGGGAASYGAGQGGACAGISNYAGPWPVAVTIGAGGVGGGGGIGGITSFGSAVVAVGGQTAGNRGTNGNTGTISHYGGADPGGNGGGGGAAGPSGNGLDGTVAGVGGAADAGGGGAGGNGTAGHPGFEFGAVGCGGGGGDSYAGGLYGGGGGGGDGSGSLGSPGAPGVIVLVNWPASNPVPGRAPFCPLLRLDGVDVTCRQPGLPVYALIATSAYPVGVQVNQPMTRADWLFVSFGRMSAAGVDINSNLGFRVYPRAMQPNSGVIANYKSSSDMPVWAGTCDQQAWIPWSQQSAVAIIEIYSDGGVYTGSQVEVCCVPVIER